MVGFKLFRVRQDGTLGSLFMNPRARIPLGKWLKAEDHRTKGFAHRPLWHAVAKPFAPHLSMKGRQWFKIEMKGAQKQQRPVHQGSNWYLAKQIRVLGPV